MPTSLVANGITFSDNTTQTTAAGGSGPLVEDMVPLADGVANVNFQTGNSTNYYTFYIGNNRTARFNSTYPGATLYWNFTWSNTAGSGNTINSKLTNQRSISWGVQALSNSNTAGPASIQIDGTSRVVQWKNTVANNASWNEWRNRTWGGGNSFNTLKFTLTKTTPGGDISHIAVTSVNTSVVRLFATSLSTNSFFYSDDFGATYTEILLTEANGGVISSSNVYSVAASGNTVLVNFYGSDKMAYSIDTGTTWTIHNGTEVSARKIKRIGASSNTENRFAIGDINFGGQGFDSVRIRLMRINPSGVVGDTRAGYGRDYGPGGGNGTDSFAHGNFMTPGGHGLMSYRISQCWFAGCYWQECRNYSRYYWDGGSSGVSYSERNNQPGNSQTPGYPPFFNGTAGVTSDDAYTFVSNSKYGIPGTAQVYRTGGSWDYGSITDLGQGHKINSTTSVFIYNGSKYFITVDGASLFLAPYTTSANLTWTTILTFANGGMSSENGDLVAPSLPGRTNTQFAAVQIPGTGATAGRILTINNAAVGTANGANTTQVLYTVPGPITVLGEIERYSSSFQ